MSLCGCRRRVFLRLVEQEERASASAAVTFNLAQSPFPDCIAATLQPGGDNHDRISRLVRDCVIACAKDRKLPDKQGLTYCWQARRFLNHASRGMTKDKILIQNGILTSLPASPTLMPSFCSVVSCFISFLPFLTSSYHGTLTEERHVYVGKLRALFLLIANDSSFAHGAFIMKNRGHWQAKCQWPLFFYDK